MAKKYTHIEEINSGGFGRVDKVKDESGNKYAMKTFEPSPQVLVGTTIDRLRERFIREVEVQAELDPEHFVPVIDSNLDLPRPFFIMPLATHSFAKSIGEFRETGDDSVLSGPV